VIGAVVGVAVEVEERRLGQFAPDRRQPLPVEMLVRLDIVVEQLQDCLRSASEPPTSLASLIRISLG
jgi:hypothetical protein